ncbi:hypothetical protein NQ317_016010 [Molorchus minor]|uniref:FHA domain-containing protein n=1 Tax=Molorchus minor TaxID=1323400 RepID=A0ABQ9JWY9_9CUCU|nr:hypothetical protein NQ317_016010 [Molorchus minor]
MDITHKVEDTGNLGDTLKSARSDTPFKKPILIGKIGRLPRKVLSQKISNDSDKNHHYENVPTAHEHSEAVEESGDNIGKNLTPAKPVKIPTQVSENYTLPYKEPLWSGLPKTTGNDYLFEVLKNGSIIETINLMERSFWVFGRLVDCHISMQHPTISRYHAILQYRSESSENEVPGFYIYDLGSTHGTFLNKNRLKPKVYTRVQVSEDADEETDLSENPYAQTSNEELYLDDPKKALRGFFEREGFDLEYDCAEQGIGQFLCKVELPIDNELGRPIVAEVLHRGKKKEAVVQCALEACRILDRYGVLRQATHESRKRKAKNWEENDYYDSDEDTFLDRTGTIEKKREKRMNAKVPQKADTYETLLDKEKIIATTIDDLERQLAKAQELRSTDTSNIEDDSLDTFMKELKRFKA